MTPLMPRPKWCCWMLHGKAGADLSPPRDGIRLKACAVERMFETPLSFQHSRGSVTTGFSSRQIPFEFRVNFSCGPRATKTNASASICQGVGIVLLSKCLSRGWSVEMVSNVTIAVWLIVLACALGIPILGGIIAAARSLSRQDTAAHARTERLFESGWCVYDCMLWFREKPELVRYCGLACGIPSPSRRRG